MIATVADRCQALVGRILDGDTRNVLLEVRQIAHTLPSTTAFYEQLTIVSVLVQFVSRLALAIDLSHRSAIEHHVAVLMSSGHERWLAEFDRLIHCCIDGLPEQLAVPSSRPTSQAFQKLMDLIESEYTDPRLCLTRAARAIHRSPSHVSRSLKRHTQRTFPAIVCSRRIVAAQMMLIESTLTLKEIARAVGFNDASRFCVQFKRATGITASTYRSRMTRTT